MLDGWKTIIGIVIAAAAALAKQYGFDFDVAGVSDSLVILAGLVIALYGRLVAVKPGPFAPKPPVFEDKPAPKKAKLL